MTKEIIVKRKAARLLEAGSPLISQQDLAREFTGDEGDLVRVIDEQSRFIGMAYIGFQNKGIAWIYSRQDQESLSENVVNSFFETAKAKRHHYFNQELTTAFRLFNGEGDGLGGVTIDWYDGFAVVSWYSLGIYLWRELILAQLVQVFPEIRGVYEKIRFKQEAGLPESSWLFGEVVEEPLMILEEGIRYATYLNEGLMTGIFLDQREVRSLLRDEYSAGKRVLNLFSYTGAFSVAAAVGGAIETTSVDVANRSLEKTREQFSVNGISPETQKIYVMDVFDYIKYALKKQLTFDTLVLDPPSFARTKKRTFSVVKDYANLVTQLVPLVETGGTMILSTNAANVSAAQFLEMIDKGIRSSGRNYRVTYQKKLPEDFAVAPYTQLSDYLKVIFVALDV